MPVVVLTWNPAKSRFSASHSVPASTLTLSSSPSTLTIGHEYDAGPEETRGYATVMGFDVTGVTAGQQINSATLTATRAVNGVWNGDFRLYGRAVDTWAGLTATIANPPRTSAFTTMPGGGSSTANLSVDATAVVAEIVARPGFAATLALMVEPNTNQGGTSLAGFNTPTLTIDYGSAATSPSNTTPPAAATSAASRLTRAERYVGETLLQEGDAWAGAPAPTVARRWVQGVTLLATAAEYTPTAAGTYTPEAQATNASGSTAWIAGAPIAVRDFSAAAPSRLLLSLDPSLAWRLTGDGNNDTVDDVVNCAVNGAAVATAWSGSAAYAAPLKAHAGERSLVLGGSSHITTDRSINLARGWTVALWARPTAVSGAQTLLAAQDGTGTGVVVLGFDGSDVVTYLTGAKVVLAAGAAAAGGTLHLALAHANGQLTLSVGGVAGTPQTLSIPANAAPLRVGADKAGANRFTGSLQDVRCYERWLSGPERAALAAEPAAPYVGTPRSNYQTYRLKEIAAAIVAGNEFVCLLGDSTASPTNSPRWMRSILRQWDVPFRGLVLLANSSSAADEGFQFFGDPATTVNPGSLLGNGRTVPHGFVARTRYAASNESDFAQLHRPGVANLDLQKRGDWTIGAGITFRFATTQNVLARTVRSFYQRNGGTVVQSQKTSPLAAEGLWQAWDHAHTAAPGTTPAVRVEAYLDNPSGVDETGTAYTLGAFGLYKTGATTGTVLTSIATGGFNASNHLPQQIGGLNTGQPLGERLSKWRVFGWPSVYFVQLGINMSAPESSSIAAWWGQQMRRLLDWHRELHLSEGQPAPKFVCVVPWATSADTARQQAIEQELAEIADERAAAGLNDCGVLNMFRVVEAAEGAYSAWQATLLADGVHQSNAGADRFGVLSWDALVTASTATIAATSDAVFDLSRDLAGDLVRDLTAIQ